MLFELHCHSKYSRGTKIPVEGTPSPSEIIRTAKRKGLGGIALTDHDNVQGLREAKREARKQGILFIPGEEIGSKAGHILGLGVNELIKPDLPLEETLDKIWEQGGVAVAAHPFDPRGKGLKRRMNETDAAEVFNAMSVDRFSNWASGRIAQKLGARMVCGSDAHTLNMVGMARNRTKAQNLDGVLKAIKRGKVGLVKDYVTAAQMAEWIRIRMLRSQKFVFRYIDKNYWQPKKAFSKFFLRRYVNHPHNPLWLGLTHLGMGAIATWSAMRLLRYYYF